MRWLSSPETRVAVLRNPIVLAGLAVVVLLGLTAGILVVVDSARRGNAETPKVVVDQSTATIGPTSKTAEAVGVHGTTKDITAVRQAPGGTTPVLGTVQQGADLVIDGRTTDSGWYRVIFPPFSELHGWVEARQLTISGDPSTLVVATAEPPVVVVVPTEPATATPTPNPNTTTPLAGTPTVLPLPDLVIGTTPTISSGKLFVTVINQGKGVAHGVLTVAVFDETGAHLLGGTTLNDFTLDPGRSVDVATGLAVAGEQTLLVIVDPNGVIAESDDTNNRILIHVQTGGPPTPTATPRPGETPPPPAGG
jgi:uncharacterized protein YraI